MMRLPFGNLICQNCGKELSLYTKPVHNIGHIACKECDHVLHPVFIKAIDNSVYCSMLNEFRPKFTIGNKFDGAIIIDDVHNINLQEK